MIGNARSSRGLIFVVVALATALALAALTLAGTQEASAKSAGAAKVGKAVRAPDAILGRPRYSRAQAMRYARSVGATRYITKTIPLYYKVAPRVGIAPDVLVAQAMVETGNGHYGGDARPWNMAGIKKRNATGDRPRDFERPKTPYAGVRMHVNHMAAYTGKKPLGKPHGRYYVARDVQKQRGYWVRKVSQLGKGTWATDPSYSRKIRLVLNKMGRS